MLFDKRTYHLLQPLHFEFAYGHVDLQELSVGGKRRNKLETAPGNNKDDLIPFAGSFIANPETDEAHACPCGVE